MNAEQYKNAGYRVSMQVSQDEIDRAERDAVRCYLDKVCTYDSADASHKEAVMQLAFILLVQRSVVATRSGGKEKTSPSLSENGYPSQTDFDNADRLLRKVQTIGGDVSALVDDICEIYYRNKFMAL